MYCKSLKKVPNFIDVDVETDSKTLLESGAEDMNGALHIYKSSNSSETKAVFQESGEVEQSSWHSWPR